jgi:thymidine phosphorylase
MIELGRRAGREVVCMLTDMDQPLGQAVGNALELREALATIRGEGPHDLSELVLGSVAHLLALSDLGIDKAEGRRRAEQAVSDGSAVEAYEHWIRAQDGDPAESALPTAAVVHQVKAPAAGVVERLGAIQVGVAALHLGAGRQTKEDVIDHAVGILCLRKRGDEVAAGDVLAEIHARNVASAAEAEAAVLAAYTIGNESPRERSIVLDTIS